MPRPIDLRQVACQTGELAQPLGLVAVAPAPGRGAVAAITAAAFCRGGPDGPASSSCERVLMLVLLSSVVERRPRPFGIKGRSDGRRSARAPDGG